MIVYQVNDWDALFENNKSRERDQCHFVCVPNKQDGMGLSRLLSLPNGTQIYGVFHLIVGACSRQKRPRCGWLTDTGRAPDGHLAGTAWTAADMAFRWRRSEEEIQNALDVLTGANIAWISKLEIVQDGGANEVPTKCPPSARQVPAKCLGTGGKERTGGKEARSRETSNEAAVDEPLIPSVEEVLRFTRNGSGIPDDYARHYVDKCCVKKRWLTKTHRGVELIDWRKEIVHWWVKDRATWAVNGHEPTPPRNAI